MCECTWLDYRNNPTNKGFPRIRAMSGQAGNDGKAKTGPPGNRYDNETTVASLFSNVEVSRLEKLCRMYIPA
jgi:hypothetical protein